MIIIFIYHIFNKIEISTKNSIKKENKYILKILKKFQKKYDYIIKEKINNDQLKGLVYSILILENYNRPQIIRLMEYMLFFITKKPRTMGIMQYFSNEYINNEQSITLGINKIINEYTTLVEEYKNNNKEDYSELQFKHRIANIYNNGYPYACEITTIWNKIMDNYFKNTTDKLF